MYCIQTFSQTSNESLHFLFHSFIHQSSAGGGNDGGGLGVVTARTQSYLGGGGGYGHRGSAVR